jgi:hypothetical protein
MPMKVIWVPSLSVITSLPPTIVSAGGLARL